MLCICAQIKYNIYFRILPSILGNFASMHWWKIFFYSVFFYSIWLILFLYKYNWLIFRLQITINLKSHWLVKKTFQMNKGPSYLKVHSSFVTRGTLVNLMEKDRNSSSFLPMCMVSDNFEQTTSITENNVQTDLSFVIGMHTIRNRFWNNSYLKNIVWFVESQ